MEEFIFEKKGYTFKFKNPEWDKLNKKLVMAYKIIGPGIEENKHNSDGYSYNSSFSKSRGSMSLYNVNIGGTVFTGVKLPDDILDRVTKIYGELKDADYQKRLNQDIKYTLYDTDSYGKYNGISEFDISTIVAEVYSNLECTSFIITKEEIARILTSDTQLKSMAEKNYVPDPEDVNWTDEYKGYYRKAVENKTATGYGMIPNKIIKAKITKIVSDRMEEEEAFKQKQKDRINKLFELAKSSGEKQLITQWTEPCKDPHEECNLDFVYKYAMPDGTTKSIRQHTW
jgi:hypothetical protein